MTPEQRSLWGQFFHPFRCRCGGAACCLGLPVILTAMGGVGLGFC